MNIHVRLIGIGRTSHFEDLSLEVKEDGHLGDLLNKAEMVDRGVRIFVFGGELLQAYKPLTTYGIRSGSLLLGLCSSVMDQDDQQVPEKLTKEEVGQLLMAFTAATLDRNYEVIVSRTLSRQDLFRTLISTTPGLADDPIALGILHDPVLLEGMLKTSQIESVLEKHPSLGHAAMVLAAAINEEIARQGMDSTAVDTSHGPFSLEQMSDDEAMPAESQEGAARNSSRWTITESQLSSALASVSSPHTAVPQTRTPAGSVATPVITTDLLNNALQQVFGVAPVNTVTSQAGPSGSVSATQNPLNSGQLERNTSENLSEERKVQLQQLREMGFNDDVASLRALEMKNGNLNDAVELLFWGWH